MCKRAFYYLVAVVGLTLVESRAEENTKEFPDKRCKLSLPGPDWVWDDPSTIPHTLAMAHNSQGVKLLLIAVSAPKGYYVTQRAITNFEKGFVQSSSVTKESGSLIQFRGVSCYELKVRFEAENIQGIGIIRVLGAHDTCYQLQIVCDSTPIKGLDIDSVFNGFDFTQPPAARVYSGWDEFSQNMGKVAGTCILVALIVYAIKQRRA